jgi:hypothetical protein
VASRKNAVYICGGDDRPGPRQSCPNALHDWPLPVGYVDATTAASSRISRGWLNKRCPDCQLFGWVPGRFKGEVPTRMGPHDSQAADARFLAIAATNPIDADLLDRARRHNGGYLPLGHLFIGVAGHPDDDECTYRANGTDETYCGEPEANHDPHDSDADGLDDCPACDAPLASCSRSNVCCADCTHGANWRPRIQHDSNSCPNGGGYSCTSHESHGSESGESA